MDNYEIEISEFLGQTFFYIGLNSEKNRIYFIGPNIIYQMYHEQDCCENVRVEEVIGDFNDIMGCPILKAEERTNSEKKETEVYDSQTYTFYELATIKGSVTIRWLGSSNGNGYYSENVSIIKFIYKKRD